MMIKVCGLNDFETVRKLAVSRVDFLGFIFAKESPRKFKASKELIDLIRSVDKLKVGVFVNQSFDEIRAAVELFGLDFVQLHGEEDVQFASRVQELVGLIKVFKVSDDFDFSVCSDYSFANFFLFDTKGKNAGGNGLKFNWELLNNYHDKVPFLLGGGIHLEDVHAIQKINHPAFYGIDVNSGFEIEPGIKNIELINELVDIIKNKVYAC